MVLASLKWDTDEHGLHEYKYFFLRGEKLITKLLKMKEKRLSEKTSAHLSAQTVIPWKKCLHTPYIVRYNVQKTNSSEVQYAKVKN